jgi:hypothetical protein
MYVTYIVIIKVMSEGWYTGTGKLCIISVPRCSKRSNMENKDEI